QQDEGDYQHQHADGGGAGVVVLVELDHDQQRQDFGFQRHVAGDEDHRAVLAHATGKGQRETGQPGGQQRRHQHVAEDLQRLGAQATGGFLDFPGNVGQHRLQRAHHEGQGDEGQRQGDADRAVGDLQAHGGGEPADQAVGRIQGGEGDAGHGGGQGERQVDQRIDQLAAGKAVTHQQDRKSTRLNSSHVKISYAVFCLKKKKNG